MTHRQHDNRIKSDASKKNIGLSVIPKKDQPDSTQLVRESMKYAVDVRDYGAKGDGIHDDTAALQTAINSGAGMVKISGVTTISSTINLVSNQIVYIGAGSSMQWTGSAGSTMFESPSDKMYVRAGIWCDGGFIDINGCSIGINLHSYQYCIFDWESTDSTETSTTSTIIYNISDSTSSTDSVTGTRNTTNNYWRRLMHHYSCGTLLRMAGLANGSGQLLSGNTLNSFGKIRSDGNCAAYGIDIGPWCDTNDFYSMTSLNCGSGATAINLRDYATVYNFTFHHVNVAMYGSPSSRRGVYVGNQVRWAVVDFLYVDSSNTDEVNAGAIVDGGAESYKINLCRATGQFAGIVETRSKNFSLLAANFSFSENFIVSSGTATSISNIPTNGCIVAYNSSNGDFTGICYVRTSASPSCFSIAGDTTYIVFSTGSLGNGGGTNSRLNISAGSDGKLYISNRLQISLNLTITCLGGLY